MRRFDVAASRTRRMSRRSAWAAALLAWAFAAVNLYWALGGTAGVATLGGQIEELAARHSPALAAANATAVVVKLAVGVMALSLVRDGGRVPRRLRRAAGWAAAVVLTAYGALQTGAVALVYAGVLVPDEPPPIAVLRWRLLLWEPWFLLIGLLLLPPLLVDARRRTVDEPADSVADSVAAAPADECTAPPRAPTSHR